MKTMMVPLLSKGFSIGLNGPSKRLASRPYFGGWPIHRHDGSATLSASLLIPQCGAVNAKLRCNRPSGRQIEVGTKTLDLSGDYRGVYLTGTIDVRPKETGWHIFDVIVNDTVITHIPLNLSVAYKANEAQGIVTEGVGKVERAYSHPSCYARGLANCSKKISREHYVSKNFLSELNRSGGLRVGGLPWQKPGDMSPLPPSAMTAKVLCERHNHLLSTLDDLGGMFFRSLNNIHSACCSGTHHPNDILPLTIDGNKVERFLLKILLGGIASGNLRGPGGEVFGTDITIEILKVLFGESCFPPSTGLFLVGRLNEPWLAEPHLQVAVLLAEGEPFGMLVNIAPLRFVLAVTPEGKNAPILAGRSFYRPRSVTVTRSVTVIGGNSTPYKITLQWAHGSQGQDIVVNDLDRPGTLTV